MRLLRTALRRVRPSHALVTSLCLMGALWSGGPVPAGDNEAPDVPRPVTEVTARIDAAIARGWSEHDVTPAGDCSDAVFLRRVTLDLAGRIPTPDERLAFLADERPDKRSRLVDRLLAGEDHVQHVADVLDTLLMGRGTSKDYARRERHQWRAWLEQSIRDNRPWNEMAADILRARPQSDDERGAVWFLYERNDDHQKIAEAVAPSFFGMRIECAQCHDHMMAAEIEQRHYWGLVAFFSRGTNTDTPNGPRVQESAVGGFSEFADLSGDSSPNLLTFYQADAVEEERPAPDSEPQDTDDLYRPPQREGEPRVPKFSRREKFVDAVFDGHPQVARAFVNRLWAMLFGRGLVHPFDEMDSVHPPSHPDLLDWLAADFEQSGCDMRRMTRAMVLSRSYQLESVAPPGVDDPALFAWAIEKPLTAEQLGRSIQLAVRGEFANDDPLMATLRDALPDVMPEEPVTAIGDALFLSNNAALNEFLAASTHPQHLIGRVRELPSCEERAELLFTTIFGRLPDEEEVERLRAFLTVEADDPAVIPDSSSADDARRDRLTQRLELVVWAMLTSAEFRFNH